MERSKIPGKVLKVLEAVESFGPEEERLFIEALFARAGGKKRLQWFGRLCRVVYPEARRQKLERWMEGMFTRDMRNTPRKVAKMSVNYFGVDSRMMPFLIKTAQRVKKRVWIRLKRSGRLTGEDNA